MHKHPSDHLILSFLDLSTFRHFVFIPLPYQISSPDLRRTDRDASQQSAAARPLPLQYGDAVRPRPRSGDAGAIERRLGFPKPELHVLISRSRSIARPACADGRQTRKLPAMVRSVFAPNLPALCLGRLALVQCCLHPSLAAADLLLFQL